MESWKKNVTEVGMQDVGPGSYSATRMPGEGVVASEWFVDALQEIIPFANAADIKPYYEDLKDVLGKSDADPDEIAIASLALLYAVGSTLIDGTLPGKMAKAGRKAAEVGFQLAPKIASAAKKIEKAPFELKSKAAKQGKDLPFQLKPKTVELAKGLPAKLQSKAVKQGKDLPFELKSKPVKQGKEQPFVLKSKE